MHRKFTIYSNVDHAMVTHLLPLSITNRNNNTDGVTVVQSEHVFLCLRVNQSRK